MTDTEKYRKLIEKSLGNYLSLDEGVGTLIQVASELAATHKGQIEGLLDLRDVDKVSSEFLPYLEEEFGLLLPQGTKVESREFLRQSKTWYSSKGTEGLLSYIGDLTDSRVSIEETAQYILRLSDPNTLISGTDNIAGGSKLGRLRDGIVWAFYVYFLDVLLYEGSASIEDILTLVNLNHPIGTNYFSRWNYYQGLYDVSDFSYLRYDHLHDRKISEYAKCLLSAGFTLSGKCQLSVLRPEYSIADSYINYTVSIYGGCLLSNGFHLSRLCKLSTIAPEFTLGGDTLVEDRISTFLLFSNSYLTYKEAYVTKLVGGAGFLGSIPLTQPKGRLGSITYGEIQSQSYNYGELETEKHGIYNPYKLGQPSSDRLQSSVYYIDTGNNRYTVNQVSEAEINSVGFGNFYYRTVNKTGIEELLNISFEPSGDSGYYNNSLSYDDLYPSGASGGVVIDGAADVSYSITVIVSK